MIAGLIVVGLVWGVGVLYGVHFTDVGAVASSQLASDQVRIVMEQPAWFGKAVLFEDPARGTFGTTHLKRSLFMFWQLGGGSYGYRLEPGKPFQATGYSSRIDQERYHTVVAVKVDPQIKYVAVGSEDPDFESPQRVYDLTLERARSLPAFYKVQPVDNGYALFTFDEIAEASMFTFRAFDADGKLVADELFGYSVRWLNR